MGATLSTWRTKVAALIRDSGGLSFNADDIVEIGIVPAITQFAIDRPRSIAVDKTPPADSRECPEPTTGEGWITGFSTVQRVDAPAGEIPATRIDGWHHPVASSADPNVDVILLPGNLATGEQARVYFTATYPTPDTNASTDLVPDVAFHPVTSLAAAYLLESASAEAAQQRDGAFPTDFVAEADRSRDLYDTAARLRIPYNTYIGLGPEGDAAGSRSLRSTKMR